MIHLVLAIGLLFCSQSMASDRVSVSEVLGLYQSKMGTVLVKKKRNLDEVEAVLYTDFDEFWGKELTLYYDKKRNYYQREIEYACGYPGCCSLEQFDVILDKDHGVRISYHRVCTGDGDEQASEDQGHETFHRAFSGVIVEPKKKKFVRAKVVKETVYESMNEIVKSLTLEKGAIHYKAKDINYRIGAHVINDGSIEGMYVGAVVDVAVKDEWEKRIEEAACVSLVKKISKGHWASLHSHCDFPAKEEIPWGKVL